MLSKCCTQHVSIFGKLSSDHRTGEGQFSFQSQERQCQRMSKLPYAAAKSLQSCPTLCDPIDGSPPGSTVPGILQARTLEWVAISFSNAWKWTCSVVSDSRDPMDCSLPGSSVHGIFQARVLEWVPLPSLTVALFHMLATLQWAVPASEQAALLTSTPNYRKDSKYFHPQGQICLLLQVFLDFLLLHSSPLMKRTSFLGVSSKRACRSS